MWRLLRFVVRRPLPVVWLLLVAGSALAVAPEFAFRAAERGWMAEPHHGDAEIRASLARCQLTPDATLICPTRFPATYFSPHLYSALVAAEDHRFLLHNGVDNWGLVNLVRSFAAEHLLGAGNARGGSTITQQLARRLFLSNEDSMRRKYREIMLARQIERLFSKAEILTLYLNSADFAGGRVGAEEAALTFFGKPARALDIFESAMLVAQLPAPNRRDPRDPGDADELYDATVLVLHKMLAEELVSLADHDNAIAEAFYRLHARRVHVGSETFVTLDTRPYLDAVRIEAERLGLALEGRRILLYMEPRLQALAVAAAAESPPGYDMSAVIIAHTGELRAVGADFDRTQFNAGVNAVGRSLASLGKLAVLIVAAELRALDEPVSAAPARGDWPAEPNPNCGGGATTLAEAVVFSCNRPFVNFAASVRGELLDTATAMGILPAGLDFRDAPRLAVGGAAGNLLSATRAFATLGNGGRMPVVRAVAAVVDPDGNVRFADPAPPPVEVTTPAVATAVRDALRGPVLDPLGTARAARTDAALVAGKTGTSDNNRDAWFIGLTEQWTGGIWAGTDAASGQGGLNGSFPAERFGRLAGAYYAVENARGEAWQAALEARIAALDIFTWRWMRVVNWFGYVGAWQIAPACVFSACVVFARRFWRPRRLQAVTGPAG